VLGIDSGRFTGHSEIIPAVGTARSTLRCNSASDLEVPEPGTPLWTGTHFPVSPHFQSRNRDASCQSPTTVLLGTGVRAGG